MDFLKFPSTNSQIISSPLRRASDEVRENLFPRFNLRFLLALSTSLLYSLVYINTPTFLTPVLRMKTLRENILIAPLNVPTVVPPLYT